MEDEEQPLLEVEISHIAPVADDQSFILRRPSRLSTTLRQARRLSSPVSNWFLYPLHWLILWLVLSVQAFQGVLYRCHCAICRKKAGTVDQLLASSTGGCPNCALYVEVLAAMAPEIQPELGLFILKSENWFKKYPLVLSVWNVGGFETAMFRFLDPRG